MVSNVQKAIQEDVHRLIQQKQFKALLTKEAPISKGDALLINNSFLHRGVGPTKSEKYLALIATSPNTFGAIPSVATPGTRILKPLKRFSATWANLNSVDLPEAIAVELASLGSLLFVLVGELSSPPESEVTIASERYNSLRWSTDSPEPVHFAGRQITIRQPGDIDTIWAKIQEHAARSGVALPPNFEQTVIDALQRLQAQATVLLQVPTRASRIPEDSFIDQVNRALAAEEAQYKKALLAWEQSNYSDNAAFDQLLKISYNFATDAARLIKLVMKICDLKPIVLWGTVAEHFALLEAFDNLTWTKSTRKPLLEDYRDTIADSRNRAFHNLFRFDTSIEVILPQDAITDVRLKIFSEYTRRRENKMLFRDDAMADVLLEFTRAKARYLSASFWPQQLSVMQASRRLFARTGDFLRLLLAAA